MGVEDRKNAVLQDVSVGSADVAGGGSFTVPYPSGTSKEDFTDTNAVVYLWGAYRECAVSRGASEFTVTWPAGKTLPSIKFDKVGKYGSESDNARIVDVKYLMGRAVNLAKAGLAIGTDTTKVKTSNAIEYAVKGVQSSKAATDDAVGLPATTDLGNSEKALFLFGIDDGGVFNSWGTEPVADGEDIEWPELPEGHAPVGGIKVETDGSSTFDPGTDALDKTGVTVTYYDFAAVPTEVY
jgi:hypothetical protein